jgi:hypothetical protein
VGTDKTPPHIQMSPPSAVQMLGQYVQVIKISYKTSVALMTLLDCIDFNSAGLI